VKPPDFHYHAPTTLTEVIALLGRLENARLLAGGQSLMPMLAMRYVMPDHIVDLNRVEGLAYIRADADAVRIGAMTRQREIEFSAVIARDFPIVAEAIRLVGHRQTRNRGTIGGSLCHLDPSAELVTLCAALDAEVIIAGAGGTRSLPFAKFPAGYMSSAVELGECLTEIMLPRWPLGHGYAFVEFSRRHGDFAIVSAAALLVLGPDGRIARASITLGGVGAAPIRMAAIEHAITGQAATPALFTEAVQACRSIKAMDDVHASAAYRRRLAVTMARRALETAASRAGTANSRT
jgi:carbon-monoxide dehydrogenase medium subunit